MISKRAKKVKPSATLSIDTKAKEMKAAGIDVISFAVGEPDFDTPDNIKAAAIKAINEGFTKYTPVGGIPELKNAIAAKLQKDNGLDYKPNEILVSVGAKHSLYNAAQALYSEGDEVIIPAPYWVSYPDQTLLNDAAPVIVETREEDLFVVSPDQLSKAVTKKTKAIVLNYPSNPTGFTYDRKALEAIAEIAVKNNIYVISDEIYEMLLYDGLKHVSIASIDPEIKKRTIVINGFSKSYAMTGWRIGYAAGDAAVIKAMENIQSQSTSNPTSISQKAALEAVNGPQDFIPVMLTEFDKRRKYLVAELNAIDGVSCKMPQGAFYAFANIKAYLGKKSPNMEIADSSAMALYLLEEAAVALVPGSAFGAEGYIRMSYATSMEKITEGLKRLKSALQKLA
ncbi:aspartate aminotransferase [Candidatus Magnetominusculus xianensis]|uniref:Aminotransferase n=2 Tax=Candidatus Magnetominusculus xianensis TaxID=1748249 RepID=A0ABR5SE15_9BACT|nr:pyridoxal phosphate-dependent aminotransferase [Candidatus Magnetominusculus xianensis]KWT84005.1 aspartate aminotransferase [Candidatus Magnetominusculus xianensis]